MNFLKRYNKIPEFQYRESIIRYLKQMSDPIQQERIGPIEAFNEWFDDLYVPCHDPNIYNPGVFEKGLADFKSCFTTIELKAMARYHDYLNSISDNFNVDRPCKEIVDDPRWIKLTLEAKTASTVFSNDSKSIKQE